VYAYLGVKPDQTFILCVSLTALNPAGPRLERGRQRLLPENVFRAAQNPGDSQAAIAGLISLQRFLRGEEQGVAPLEFGVDELPLLRRKKK
jgi:hypothetical protein